MNSNQKQKQGGVLIPEKKASYNGESDETNVWKKNGSHPSQKVSDSTEEGKKKDDPNFIKNIEAFEKKDQVSSKEEPQQDWRKVYEKGLKESKRTIVRPELEKGRED